MVPLGRRPDCARLIDAILPNAEVDYVDADTGILLTTIPFWDPFLAEDGEMGYECGRPL